MKKMMEALLADHEQAKKAIEHAKQAVTKVIEQIEQALAYRVVREDLLRGMVFDVHSPTILRDGIVYLISEIKLPDFLEVTKATKSWMLDVTLNNGIQVRVTDLGTFLNIPVEGFQAYVTELGICLVVTELDREIAWRLAAIEKLHGLRALMLDGSEGGRP